MRARPCPALPCPASQGVSVIVIVVDGREGDRFQIGCPRSSLSFIMFFASTDLKLLNQSCIIADPDSILQVWEFI